MKTKLPALFILSFFSAISYVPAAQPSDEITLSSKSTEKSSESSYVINLTGTVFDSGNGLPLDGVKLSIIPFLGKPVIISSDENGNYSFNNVLLPLYSGPSYTLKVEKEGYFSQEYSKSSKIPQKDELNFKLQSPTIENTLKQIKDNYAKISNFKADMVMASTFNDKSFGETQYCKYYFLAPGKEKTETFLDKSRTTKTESIITDGANLYLIDSVNKTTRKVDMLEESGMNEGQFNQMDLYYNQENFLNTHTITINTSKNDLNNYLVCLEALPKEPNNLYTKLELTVDYKKGLLVKNTLYRQNENKEEQLIQIVEITKTINISGIGAWLPVEMKKTPITTAGSFFSSLKYENLEVNTNISDDTFNPEKEY